MFAVDVAVIVLGIEDYNEGVTGEAVFNKGVIMKNLSLNLKNY